MPEQTAPNRKIEEQLTFQAEVLAQVSDAVVVIDKQRNVSYWNKAAEQLYGFSYEQAIGRNLDELYTTIWANPQDLQTSVETIAKFGVWKSEVKQRTAKGTEIYVEAAVSSLKDGTGQNNGLLAINRDITERKQAQNQVRENKELLQAIIDNSTANIYVKNRQGRFLLINRRMERLYRLDRGSAIGKNNYELFPDTPGEKIAEWEANDYQVIDTAIAMEIEERVMEADGLHTYLSVKFPLYNATGEAYAVCGLSTDITERTQAEDTRKELDRQKDEFLIIAGHELRTPLTAIKGYTQLLQRKVSSSAELETELKLLNNINHQSNRMNGLINEMLDVSRIERGQLQAKLYRKPRCGGPGTNHRRAAAS